MISKHKTKILIVAVLVITGSVFYYVFGSEKDLLEVHFLDVGQGDAILIKTPQDQKILIDGGPDNSIVRELDQKMDHWENTIDLVILTHPHSDHVTGLNEVFKKYEVKKVYYTGVEHTSPDFIAWLELIKEKNIPYYQIKARQNIIFSDNLKMEILFPDRDITNEQIDNLNNTSIALKLSHADIDLVLTGDAEEDLEHELIEKYGALLDSEILKLGHHGSKTASTMRFLEVVNPEIAIIQVGENNDFYMPHVRTLHTISKFDIDLYRNDLNGSVSVISDGTKYWLETEK